MVRGSDLIRLIRVYRRHRKWTVSDLARNADVPRATIHGMDDEDWNPGVQVLDKLIEVVPDEFAAGHLAT